MTTPPTPPGSSPPEAAHAIPLASLYAALFPARDVTAPRRFVMDAAILAADGLEVTFSGEEFDQTDLEVAFGILETGTVLEEDTFACSAPVLLTRLGKATDGRDHEWLYDVIGRLRSGVVEVRRQRKRFIGRLFNTIEYDESTGDYDIEINPRWILVLLFGYDLSTLENAPHPSVVVALGRALRPMGGPPVTGAVQ